MQDLKKDLVLAPEEIAEITHYTRTADQLKFLRKMGIPATHREHDNSVCVLRMYVTVPPVGTVPAANDGPQLKSSRK